MSDNDLISPNLDELIRRRDAMEAVEAEENLIGAMDSLWDGSFKRTKRAAVRVIAGVPAVPREMTAREYVKARSRMCDAQYELFGSDEHDMTACIECPLEDYCEGVKKDAEAEVAIVEKWAREHPETDMMTAKYALPRIDFKEGSDK